MIKRNPYAISFGRVPNQYINRSVVVDSIVEAVEDDPIREQAFKLTGLRGTGKTVTLTAIEKKLRSNGDFIVVGLKSNSDIMRDLVAELYSQVPFITEYVDAKLNLSAFGIGIEASKKSPVASLGYALKMILKQIDKKKKRVLITIDEVRKTQAIVDFIQEFQLLIREDLPIFIIVAGLYEDIQSVENADGLTFFLRAEKYEMKPLNITTIREDYIKTLGVSREVAEELAYMTKGYPFAYQALGKFMWDSGRKKISQEVLSLLDETLSEKVYEKIWSELAPKDRFFLEFISQKDTIAASELLEITKKKHNEWSEPRKRLHDKGIIDASIRGQVSMRLPRFKEFIEGLR